MSLLIDLLHILVAAILAVLGLTYERDDSDCPPVRFEPAAHYSTEAPPFAMEPAVNQAGQDARWRAITRECEPRRISATLPVL
ncbi:hypothetical protein F1654_01180 [Alkalicaulis satelles]|uniref:Uncharacterized protein n=1 Tax=Alkalicaulis satelles TaxID=2609175 RepID=A0A5M6ZIP3_9PROT|nr:hypothetical protein [Alkalicaulis satelles]KAA5804649.1 hypothetical protein F1654_01180 [Alkalicaulis satelles]